MGLLEARITTHETHRDGEHYWYAAGWNGRDDACGHLIGTEADALDEARRRAMWVRHGSAGDAPVIVFGGREYYPGGGVADLIGLFPTDTVALQALNPEELDWLQFCRPDTLELLATVTADYVDGPRYWRCTFLTSSWK